jgi:RHS repeat-associated protein
MTTDPDKGKSTTAYNALDQIDTTVPNGEQSKKLIYEYDDLGRQTGMWQASKTDANKLAAWTFDTLVKGQPHTAVRYDGGATSTGKAYTQKVTAYDNLYQVTGNQVILPATDSLVAAGVKSTLDFSTSYNLDGTISQYSSPAIGGLPAETVSYRYNSTGQQISSSGATGYLQGAAFSPQGDLRQLTVGMDPASSSKKAYLNWDYEDGTRRLTRSFVTDDVHGYMPQELKFTQDDAGNVTSIFDATSQGGTAKADYQCFTYDGYSRLTEAWTPKAPDCAASGRTMANIDGAGPYWTSYTYNQAGQRKTETKHTTTGDETTTYVYDDTTKDTKPHTLDRTTGARVGSYTYDSSGNTISRPGPTAAQNLAWNAEGKLAKLTENTRETSYLYDARGELLIRQAKGDGDTILYLGGGNEVRLTVKGTAKTLSGARYYTANGQTIAVRTATAGVTGTKLSFLAADHHGTSSIALDANTYAVTKRYSTPFGAPRGTKPTSWPDDKAFLGKPADDLTGLTHIGAREYDPTIGQFISVDPLLIPDAPQSLNGYTYADNAPVTSSDPTGLCNDPDCPTRPCRDCENTTPGTIPGPPKPSQNAQFAEQGLSYNSGTSHTSSSGQTSSGPYYSCKGYGPGEKCLPINGPEDLPSNSGNYLSSLLSNGDFWSGLIETIGGAFTGGGGGVLIVSGFVECGTGILCVAGAPSMATGVAGVYVGKGMIDSGSDKLGKAFNEASAASGGGETSVGQVPYGGTRLGKSVALQRLLDKNKTKGNYAAGRLEDGTVLVGRSGSGIHAEEDVIRQANGKRIVDMYSEREPCANKCQKLTSDMNVTYTVRWNGVDRDAANAELKKAMRSFFDSI